MSIRLIFSFAALFIVLSNANGQGHEKQFKADSIFIYKDFNEHGTTGHLRCNHIYLDSTHASMTKISNEDLAKLVDIFNSAPRKKLFQQKYGGDICYVLVYNKGIKTPFVLYTEPGFGILDDLNNMKRWTLKNPTDTKRFAELVKKYWP